MSIYGNSSGRKTKISAKIVSFDLNNYLFTLLPFLNCFQQFPFYRVRPDYYEKLPIKIQFFPNPPLFFVKLLLNLLYNVFRMPYIYPYFYTSKPSLL